MDKNLETTIPNIHVVGDGADLSHDIMNAAATGIDAGRSIGGSL